MSICTGVLAKNPTVQHCTCQLRHKVKINPESKIKCPESYMHPAKCVLCRE